MNKLDKARGLHDARSTRGILARGPARYNNRSNAAVPGNIQQIAQNRLKQINQRRLGVKSLRQRRI
jgi:hypothetical protein